MMAMEPSLVKLPPMTVVLGQDSQPISGFAGEGQSGSTGQNSAAPGGAGAPGGGKPVNSFGGGLLIPMMLLLFIFMIMSTMMSSRKQKKKRLEMMSSLGKQSKVQTIGGVIGIVSEVRDDTVVIKVEDGTRIRFAKSAIQTVLSSKDSEGSQAVQEVKPELQATNI